MSSPTTRFLLLYFLYEAWQASQVQMGLHYFSRSRSFLDGEFNCDFSLGNGPSPVDTLLCYCSLIVLMDRRLIWRVLERAACGQEATSLLACKVSSIDWVSGWCGIKLHTLQSSSFLLVYNETVVRSALIPNCFPLSHLSCFCCMLGYIWVQLHHNHSCLGSN